MNDESALVGSRSGIGVGVAVALVLRQWLSGNTVASVCPSRQVVIPAPFTAERPPLRIDRTLVAQDAQLCLAHPNNHNSGAPKSARTCWKQPTFLLGPSCGTMGGAYGGGSVFDRGRRVVPDVER